MFWSKVSASGGGRQWTSYHFSREMPPPGADAHFGLSTALRAPAASFTVFDTPGALARNALAAKAGAFELSPYEMKMWEVLGEGALPPFARALVVYQRVVQAVRLVEDMAAPLNPGVDPSGWGEMPLERVLSEASEEPRALASWVHLARAAIRDWETAARAIDMDRVAKDKPYDKLAAWWRVQTRA